MKLNTVFFKVCEEFCWDFDGYCVEYVKLLFKWLVRIVQMTHQTIQTPNQRLLQEEIQTRIYRNRSEPNRIEQA